MGSFGGHALPGGFFVVFSLWWSWMAARRYHNCQRHKTPYRSSVTFLPDFLSSKRCSNLQWEGIFKVFFTSVGIAGELITGYQNHHFAYLGNAQHATMFFFFGLSGVIDILLHHGASLPPHSDYFSALIAFAVEDLLFLFHLHGRSELDVRIHSLLLYTLHATILVGLVEMRFRRSYVVTMARSFLVLLQGTWFWQAGIILYRPLSPWKEADHKELMLVTIMFAWHVAVDFLVVVVIGLVAKVTMPFCCQNNAPPQVLYEEVRLKEGGDESDSEVEFVASKP